MSVELESVRRINNLKEGIEATTGETYTDLTEGVQALKDGYKQGGGGDIGKPYIDTSKMTSFYYFFTNGANLAVLDDIDTSNCTDFSNMFSGCGRITTIPQLNTSKGTDFGRMFNNCINLLSIPQLDTSNGTVFSYMFNQCRALQTIPQLDTSNGTGFNYMFSGCSKLETVLLTTAKSNLQTSTFQECTALKNLTIGEGWNVNIYLHYSNNLTVESLHGMIENLADLSGLTSSKVFQIGATNLAKVDEEHIAMLQAKSWNYS